MIHDSSMYNNKCFLLGCLLTGSEHEQEGKDGSNARES
jgi:hypothetical protein